MIFTTYWFLISVSIFLAIYWLMPTSKLRFWLLLAYCFLFHSHFAGASGMTPILVLSLITFFTGRSGNRLACSIGIALCTVVLCFYKYSRFFETEILAKISQPLAVSFGQFLNYALPVAPPLAISFFVFEFVHYLFEIRKGEKPISNISEFMQFSIFFPSLVSGPIKRYSQFIPSLHEGLLGQSGKDKMLGLLQVLFGFMQKVCLADNLSHYIEMRQGFFSNMDLGERWLILVFIAFRIFFDFNGYSDIAIGFARMLGIKLPPNFNHPYLALSIKDFWQRWHISLSSWIRDYIYIPLGGSHHGKLRKLANGLIAFTLCGLWHGAAWNFALWGLYHGLGLAISNSYKNIPGFSNIHLFLQKNKIFSWALTLLFVWFGWLLFFYPAPQAFKMFCLLFTSETIEIQ